jgi:hypothetical protein
MGSNIVCWRVCNFPIIWEDILPGIFVVDVLVEACNLPALPFKLQQQGDGDSDRVQFNQGPFKMSSPTAGTRGDFQ